MDHSATLITAPLVFDCTLICYFIVRGENLLDWLGKTWKKRFLTNFFSMQPRTSCSAGVILLSCLVCKERLYLVLFM